MLQQLLFVPILMELVLLLTTATPLVLLGRGWTRRRPRAAIALWFSAFLLSGLATVLAVIISAKLAFESWLLLNSRPVGTSNWLAALGLSFLPWIFLALGGIALALVNIKLAPHVEGARITADSLMHGLKVSDYFSGYPVAILELPMLIAFAVSLQGRKTIVLSRGVLEKLMPAEIEAVKWHEVGHIRGKHGWLKRISAFSLLLMPFIRTAAVFHKEVERLCEIDANNFAVKRVALADLKSAQRAFDF